MDVHPRKRKFEENVPAKYISSAEILYASLCYRSANSCLAWSPQNLIAYAPFIPATHKTSQTGERTKLKQLKAVPKFVLAITYPSLLISDSNSSGTINEVLNDLVSVPEASQYHKNNAITHLVWNQPGTCLASVDDTGQLALWESVHTIKEWTITHKIDIEEPVSAFLWLNSERMYTLSPDPADNLIDTFHREPFKGPRNPYGTLAFLVMTANGEVTAYYQRERDVFAKLSTAILSPASVDAFGRRSISHASFALNYDGSIYLAVHWAETVPKRVSLNELILEFPKDGRDGILQCKTISTITLSHSLNDKSLSLIYTAPIIHLRLLGRSQRNNVRVAVVVAEKTENVANDDGSESHFESVVGIWELREMATEIRNDFQENLDGRPIFSTEPRPVLKFIEGFKENKLITAINAYGDNTELILGFFDGTTMIEYRDNKRLGIAKAPSSDGSWVDAVAPPNFWKPTAEDISKKGSCIVGLATSPNEAFLISLSIVQECNIMKIAESPSVDDLIRSMGRLFSLSLSNHRDYSDLLQPTIDFSKLRKQKDLCEPLLQKVIGSFFRTFLPDHNSADASNTLPVSLIGPILALMLSLFRVFKQKNVQYINAYASLHLHSISEAILGSCISSEKEIMAKFESGGKSGATLKFDIASLWSLIPITAWLLDFSVFLMRDLSIFFNERKRVKAHEQRVGMTSPKPPPALKAIRASTASHIVLFLYRASRERISKNLILIQQLQAYLKELAISDPGKGINFILSYMDNLIKSCPVPLEIMLQILDEVGKVSDGVAKGLEAEEERKRFDLIMNVHPVVPAKYEKTLDQIEAIVKAHGSVMRSFDLYAHDTDWLGLSLVEDSRLHGPFYKQLNIDVIRKSPLSKSGKLRQCVRCLHYNVLPKEGDVTDQSSRTAWWYARRCVCGGLWR